MIRVDHVTWTYPHADVPSLRDLDLTIAAGELVVLCGSSGSGKSTALRLINGLVPQFHEDGVLTGTVTVDGLVTTGVELDEIGLRTGTVLQHPRRQFFTGTAREEIAFAMENFGFPVERIRERVAAGLAGIAAGVPEGVGLHQLSGGQQQQVAIAACAAHRPAVVLLDEPSSNLSADAVHRLTVVLGDLRRQGVTVVVAEHRLRYLQDLADRIVVMRDGRVDAEWSAADFRAVPDVELAHEGLRGDVRAAVLPELPAAGRSVQHPVPATDVPAGALQLTDLRCRLGGHDVLDLHRVSFPAGEVTAVRGMNGAGKSTLARVVTGLQRAGGTVTLDGRVLRRRARQRAGAVVMQDVQRQLFTDSVAAELELAAADGRAPSAPSPEPASSGPASSESAGAGPTGARSAATRALAALDLTHLADRHPLSLSGGQQQRLVVAAVRLAGRRVVVFDEPSSGVDRRHLESISDQIREVAATGAVVLLISHDEDLVARAADRQLTLRALRGPVVRSVGGGPSAERPTATAAQVPVPR
ncbi:MAG TPA: ABC transporter ATP-binding protein [Cellulomonas sp.]